MFAAPATAPTVALLVQRHDTLWKPGRSLAFLTATALALLVSSAAGVGNQVYREHRTLPWLPTVVPRPVLSTFYDTTPTVVIVTRHWTKFSRVMPRYQFLDDPTVWREMHFEDWDRLDATARQDGLTRLLARYGQFVADVPLWRRMTAIDWDQVPQPVRAMAVVGMIEYWVRFYEIGTGYGLDPTLVLRTAKAIAMSESWFDHRAAYINADGSGDLGIGGASAFAREALRRLHARGLADFALDDDQYYNPWLGSRWLAFWLRLSLDEAEGDLEIAIRAYNVGIGSALEGQGHEYLAGVERRRRRYFEGPSGSPTWSTLSQYRRDQLWIPRLVVRPPLPARPPIAPCAEAGCDMPRAPLRVPPTSSHDSPVLSSSPNHCLPASDPTSMALASDRSVARRCNSHSRAVPGGPVSLVEILRPTAATTGSPQIAVVWAVKISNRACSSAPTTSMDWQSMSCGHRRCSQR
jgi:hypothetical protein